MSALAHRKAVLYPNAHWYFMLAIVVTWVGFSRSYFAQFTQTDLAHHLHGLSAGLWMTLLVVQPILYQRGQLKLHRQLGWAGVIVLVPALLIGGVKMMHMMMGNARFYPPGAVYQLSSIDALSLILFPLFLGLSLWYGRRPALHARYMTCTVLLILDPAIGRLLFFVPRIDSFNEAVNGSFFTLELILLLLIFDDKRYGPIRAPYPVALLLFLLLHLTMNFAADWTWWHTFMDSFGRLSL